jgi:hypothetical protein
VNEWRYSLRWAYPHRPCPGEEILVFEDVPAGARAPASVMALFVPGGDYAVSLDFLDVKPVAGVQNARHRHASVISSAEWPKPRRCLLMS